VNLSRQTSRNIQWSNTTWNVTDVYGNNVYVASAFKRCTVIFFSANKRQIYRQFDTHKYEVDLQNKD